MVKSACGIEAVYMCFNGTGIWRGETLRIYVHDMSRTSKVSTTTKSKLTFAILPSAQW